MKTSQIRSSSHSTSTTMELDRADEEVLLEKMPQQLPAGRRDERKDYFFAVAFAANCAAVSFITVRSLGPLRAP
jgi:hypothetical protein